MTNTFCKLGAILAATGTNATQAEDTLNLAVLLRQLDADACHAHQYGALVFHGAINLDVKVDWCNLCHTLNCVNPMAVGRNRVLEWRDCGQQRITLQNTVTTV